MRTFGIRKALLAIVVVIMGGAPSMKAQFSWEHLAVGAVQAIQALTLSDTEMIAQTKAFIQQYDQQHKVASSSNAYSVRLRRITNGITSVDGRQLNFKVYLTNDINAFACADGSIRVYSGLMDIMTDDEILGVIGHEIGHVHHNHSKKQTKRALLMAAAVTGAGSIGSTVRAFTDSGLAVIGTAISKAQYSQRHENQADEYACEFLKKYGRNPWQMAMALDKLRQVSPSSGSFDLAEHLFSDHPSTTKRIKRLAKKCKKEGVAVPKGCNLYEAYSK